MMSDHQLSKERPGESRLGWGRNSGLTIEAIRSTRRPRAGELTQTDYRAWITSGSLIRARLPTREARGSRQWRGRGADTQGVR